ncbi:MAG: NAD-dependent succinate-semialdehyde dehydrogenase [Caulobacterales bacterium]
MNEAVNTQSNPGLLKLERPELIRSQAFINGQWIDASGGAKFPVTNPADGLTIGQVADCDASVARAAVDAAATAFESYKKTTGKERAAYLRRWFDLVIQNAEDLAKLMSWEQGKPLAEARAEIAYGAGYIEWFAEEAKRSYGDVIPTPVPGRKILALKEPVGVAAIITPWNFPMAMIARKFAPALAAGCTVVAKPAGETPLSALALIYLAEQAGIPAGILNILTTKRSGDISAAWMADERVRKISFTGSTAVGKILARDAAATMKRMSMELGGDAPFIVFDDCDLDSAVDGLMKAKFRNAGQACIAANRVYVQDGIHGEFVSRIEAKVRALSIGAAAEGVFDIGPLIHAKAAGEMAAYMEDAIARGADVRVGGKVHERGACFFEPTVLVNIRPDMKVSCNEIFGPIVPIMRFSTEEEAVRLANDTPYGLAGYLYTKDSARMWRVASALQTGLVGANEGAISTEVAPFGGVKESGYGREGSKYGLADYENIKYLCVGGLS